MDGTRFETEHPKIRLDTPADLRYIHDELRKLAAEKFAQHIPKIAANDKEYEKKVQQHVDDYVSRIIELASHSISINGSDIENVDAILKGKEEENVEPYDDSLRVRVQQLQAEIETATLQVTQLRRDAPPQIAQATIERLKQELERDKKVAEATAQQIAQVDSRNAPEWNVQKLPRQDDIERSWESSLEKLAVLKDELTNTVHKISQAQDAVDYINSKKSSK